MLYSREDFSLSREMCADEMLGAVAFIRDMKSYVAGCDVFNSFLASPAQAIDSVHRKPGSARCEARFTCEILGMRFRNPHC